MKTITRFQVVNSEKFIAARKTDAIEFLRRFKWDENTRIKLNTISEKGYYVDGNKIITAQRDVLGRRRYWRKSELSFFNI